MYETFTEDRIEPERRNVTYDESWKCATEQQTIETEDPSIVFRFNHPQGNSDTHAEFLLAIRMTVLLDILPESLVSQSKLYMR